jgi:predicted DNA-binding transcriptional regulator AlpA
MGLTEEERKLLSGASPTGSSLPGRLAYTIPELVHDTGAGRSKIYQEIAAGRLKVRKLGKRTLILHGDAVAWLQSLPAA